MDEEDQSGLSFIIHRELCIWFFSSGKFGRESFFANDFNNDYETTFHATFGDRSYSWSFGWTNPPNWKNQRAKEWDNLSDCESDDEKTPDVGSCSDRAILGLPRTGPLKMEEVKTA